MDNLAAAAFFALTLAALGRTATRFLVPNADLTEGERSLLGWGVGAVVFSTAMFALGALQFLGRASIGALLVAVAIVGLPGWPGLLRSIFRPGGSRSIGAELLLACGLAVPLAVALAMALCPPFAKDALVYHLAVPKLLLQHGGFYFVPGNIYANFPMGVEMLFVPGMAFGLEQFPALVHLTFFVMAVLTLRALCRRFVGPWAASLLALVFATTPMAFVEAGWPYVDLAVVYVAVATLLGLLALRNSPSGGLLAVVALVAGFGFAAKYTGGLVAIAGAGLVWVWTKGGRRSAITGARGALLFAAVSGLPMIGWLVKNIVLTGNPVYPFLFGIFGGRGWDAFHADSFSLFLSHYGWGRGLVSTLLLPLNLALRGSWSPPPLSPGGDTPDFIGFDGVIGPFYLLLLVVYAVAVVRRRPSGSVTLGVFATWVGFGLFWVLSTQQARFLLPVLVLFLVSLATVLGRNDAPSLPRRIGAVCAAAVLVLTGFGMATPILAKVRPLDYLTGKETRDEFLVRGIHLFPLVREINENTPPDAKVLMVQVGNRGYYVERAYYSDSVIEVKYLDEQVRASTSAADLRDRLVADGFTHILLHTKFFTRSVADRNMPLVREFFRDYVDVIAERPPFALVRIRRGDP